METKQAVIAGAGVMGASLAQVYAGAGYQVWLWGRRESSLDKGRRLIALNQSTLVREGLLTQEASDALQGRIHCTTDRGCFSQPGVEVLVENIVEDLDQKRAFWREAAPLAPETALLATNTSGLHIRDIAQGMDPAYRPRFLGQHWLNPPHLLPLCELIVGQETAPETVERMRAMVEGLGKKPVCVQDINGFIVNRLQFALLREALYIVESGAATAEDVDNVMKYGLGLRYACLGPFGTADLGGLDTFDHIAGYLFADLSDRGDNEGTALRRLAEAGDLGVKSGRGFYDYSGGRDQEAIRRRDKLFIKLAKCLYQ